MTSQVTGGWSHYLVLQGDNVLYLNVQLFVLTLSHARFVSFF